MSGPYVVEVDCAGCEHCGHDRTWFVVFAPDDVAGSVSYCDQEQAEEICELQNDAFSKGLESAKRIVDAAKAFVAHEKSQSDSEDNWLEELKTSNSLDIPCEFLELVEAVVVTA